MKKQREKNKASIIVLDYQQNSQRGKSIWISAKVQNTISNTVNIHMLPYSSLNIFFSISNSPEKSVTQL